MNATVISADGADLKLLHIAAGVDVEQRDDVLRFLLQQEGIQVNAVSGAGNEGWTAAHIAACWGYQRSLDLLLRHGADPYIPDVHGLNVWDVARVYDNFDCIYVLESRMNRTVDETILIDDDDEDNRSLISNDSARETTYFDKKFGLVFVEEKGKSTDQEAPPEPVTIDDSICALDDSNLRRRLKLMGESPGPVVSSTRVFYRRRLQRLTSAVKAGAAVAGGDAAPLVPPVHRRLSCYPPEVNDLIDGRFDFAEGRRLEKELIAFFAADGSKCYFNYLLVDPRVCCAKAPDVSDLEAKFDSQRFLEFIKGIFYVGKGHGKRPLMHLYEAAFESRGKSKTRKQSDKISRILDIWQQDWGVVSLHCFQHVSTHEALARECLMIEALGLENLTNIQVGQNKTKLLRWTESKRRSAGAFLLFKSYWIFCVEGQNQIRMGDVRF